MRPPVDGLPDVSHCARRQEIVAESLIIAVAGHLGKSLCSCTIFGMARVLRLALPVAAALLLAAPASSRSRTTNVPAIFTVKVTVTNSRIGMHPAHAVRGSTVTFI